MKSGITLEVPDKCVWISDGGIDVVCSIWVPTGGGNWRLYYVFIRNEKLDRFRGVERFLIYNPN